MIDILQTSTGDVELSDDLIRTEATEQHKRDLLLASQGDFKEAPTVGVDCVSFLHDTDPADFLHGNITFLYIMVTWQQID